MAKNLPIYFIHGWGMNRAVWQPTFEFLAHHTDRALIALDLPGYGCSIDTMPTHYNLTEISQQVASQIDTPGVVVGWSLGGLVAQHIAINQAEKLQQLVLVGSTPYFAATEDWPGIQPKVLNNFQQQLKLDYKKTLERFLAIQAMGSIDAKQDIKTLKTLLLTHPEPNPQALASGLNILQHADLRSQIGQINQPTARLYGKLDSLVPKAVIAKIEQLQPASNSYIFNKASHAPFISHPNEFCQQLLELI
ncbi:pimeloyl-BioC--CoA transferase BioH [Catenovulum agarivorans DS-2]|uniref:Pimeloyl-[acyl-carrier protein] methyl ester esterase n=1 Tax=Catenovulum agarivorans DS-2 TaxID=1328313 RepID=W7QF86_9ALTE|nr:pimeloyl-ACP methyl ester esterase BioH [Catenovulum agarivorans]EWH11564.1 pimeloyl-BioC--CoA transferase BioH [Catenovulum agarivorans DS-2]